MPEVDVLAVLVATVAAFALGRPREHAIELAAIHAGDWLAKLLAVAVIVSVWQ